MKNENLLVVLGALIALTIGAIFYQNVLVEKVSNKVIEKLQKEYTPGPYGPGLDPDKVNPRVLKPKGVQPPARPNNWNEDWENQRSS